MFHNNGKNFCEGIGLPYEPFIVLDTPERRLWEAEFEERLRNFDHDNKIARAKSIQEAMNHFVD